MGMGTGSATGEATGAARTAHPDDRRPAAMVENFMMKMVTTTKMWKKRGCQEFLESRRVPGSSTNVDGRALYILFLMSANIQSCACPVLWRLGESLLALAPSQFSSVCRAKIRRPITLRTWRVAVQLRRGGRV